MAERYPIASTRRSFLKTSAAASAVVTSISFSLRSAGAADIDLTAGKATIPLVGEGYPKTDVWAFNGQVPGPIIRARQNERLSVTVSNALTEPTTVHWHGLRVPVGMDGVPYLSQAPIEPGETFTYDFELKHATPGLIGITRISTAASKWAAGFMVR